jgi:hypothetical protein
MDDRTLGILAGAAFVLVVFGLPILYLVRHKAKINRVWAELAQNNGLQLKTGRWPSVHGQQDGRNFEMGSAIGRTLSGRASSQRLNQFYVSVGVAGSVPAGIVAGRRGRLQGAGPVKTQNAEFDKKVWVDCPDKQAATAYLTPERQAALQRLASYDGVLRADEGGRAQISLLRDGYKVRSNWLEERRAAFVEIAEGLDG